MLNISNLATSIICLLAGAPTAGLCDAPRARVHTAGRLRFCTNSLAQIQVVTHNGWVPALMSPLGITPSDVVKKGAPQKRCLQGDTRVHSGVAYTPSHKFVRP
jgi:hypothetical protein